MLQQVTPPGANRKQGIRIHSRFRVLDPERGASRRRFFMKLHKQGQMCMFVVYTSKYIHKGPPDGKGPGDGYLIAVDFCPCRFS